MSPGLSIRRLPRAVAVLLGDQRRVPPRHVLPPNFPAAADQAFHHVLLEATNNELLASLSSGITAAVQWTTIFKYRTSRQPRDPIPEHRALFDAIANGDAAAARQATIILVRQAQFDTELVLGV